MLGTALGAPTLSTGQYPERTYYPDNVPVDVDLTDTGAVVTAPPESATGLQKSLRVSLKPGQAAVQVVHRLANVGMQAQQAAPWALSVMAPGGEALLPQPPMIPHPQGLLPNRGLVLWPYTDMADPRVTWGRRLHRVRQDPNRPAPFKMGVIGPVNWMAYRNGDRVFVKHFAIQPGAAYPDFGCSAEVFTHHRMLELETLGPSVTLPPGSRVEHTETWSLCRMTLPDGEEEAAAALWALASGTAPSCG